MSPLMSSPPFLSLNLITFSLLFSRVHLCRVTCCTDSEGQCEKHLGSTSEATMVSAQVIAQVSEELHKSADPSLAWSQPESSAVKGFLATNFPAMKHHLQPSSVPLTSVWCSALSQPSCLPSLIKNHSCSLEVNHLCVIEDDFGGTKPTHSGCKATTNWLLWPWVHAAPRSDFTWMFAGLQPQLSTLGSRAEQLSHISVRQGLHFGLLHIITLSLSGSDMIIVLLSMCSVS